MQVRLLGAIVARLARRIDETGGRFAAVLYGNAIPQYTVHKRAFDRVGIVYIDGTTEVLAKGLSGGRHRIYYLYSYSQHWTPGAHRAVADLLAKGIRERALCAGRG